MADADLDSILNSVLAEQNKKEVPKEEPRAVAETPVSPKQEAPAKANSASLDTASPGNSPVETPDRAKAQQRPRFSDMINSLPTADDMARQQQAKAKKEASTALFGVRFCERIARYVTYTTVGVFIWTGGRFTF